MLRNAIPDDLDRIVELRRDCYPASPPPDQLKRRLMDNARFRLPEDVWVLEADKQLVAMAATLPLQLYVPGGTLGLCGLASVAVHPSARRRGRAGALVTDLLREALRRGDALAGLFAFEYQFYRRYGYAPVVCANVWEVAPGDLPYDRACAHDVERMSVQNARAIYAACEGALGRFSLVRTQRFWEEGLGECRAYGCADGYVLYRHRTNVQQPLTSEVDVLEMVAGTPAAWRALLGHLSLLQEQVTRISIPMPADSRMPLLWREPRQRWAQEIRGEDYTTGRQTVGMALRWVDVVAALQGREYAHGPEFHCVIDVQDAAGISNGNFSLQFAADRLQVESTASPAQLQADVGSWTQWWSGACGLDELLAWGGLRGDLQVAEELARRFRTARTPYVHGLDCY